MYFVGVDLAWKLTPQRTAIVILNEKCDLINLKHATTDSEIVKILKEYPSAVGIDAPLSSLNRKCDFILRKCGVPILPVNPEFFNKHFNGFRGERIVKKLKKIGYVYDIHKRPTEKMVFEVYPYAAWRILFSGNAPKYKNIDIHTRKKSLLLLRKKTLEFLNLRLGDYSTPYIPFLNKGLVPDTHKKLDLIADMLDATISAYTVYLYWLFGNKKCIIIGNENGNILTIVNNEFKNKLRKVKSV